MTCACNERPTTRAQAITRAQATPVVAVDGYADLAETLQKCN